jgi:hypothetical protein
MKWKTSRRCEFGSDERLSWNPGVAIRRDLRGFRPSGQVCSGSSQLRCPRTRNVDWGYLTY